MPVRLDTLLYELGIDATRFQADIESINSMFNVLSQNADVVAKNIGKRFAQIIPTDTPLESITRIRQVLSEFGDEAVREFDKAFSRRHVRQNLEGVRREVNDQLSRTQKVIQFFAARIRIAIAALIGAAAITIGFKFVRSILRARQAVTEFSREFEVQMARIRGIADRSFIEPVVVKELRSLATRVPQDLAKLAEGLFFTITSGVRDVSAALVVLKEASIAAVSGLTDAQTAANVFTTVINAYQASALEAAHISDVLFTIIDQGKILFEELARIMGDVANPAAAVGVTIEELGAAIATLTRAGIAAPQAATALRNLFIQIAAAGPKATKLAKELGIDLSEAGLQAAGSFEAFIAKIAEATQGSTRLIFALSGTRRSFRALNILANTMKDQFQDLSRLFKDPAFVTGRAFRVFQENMNTTSMQLKLLRDNLLNYFKPVGDFFNAITRNLAKFLNKLFDSRTEIERTEEVLRAFGASAKDVTLAGLTQKVVDLSKAFAEVKNESKSAQNALLRFLKEAEKPRGFVASGGSRPGFAILNEFGDKFRERVQLIEKVTGRALKSIRNDVKNAIADAEALKRLQDDLGNLANEYANITKRINLLEIERTSAAGERRDQLTQEIAGLRVVQANVELIAKRFAEAIVAIDKQVAAQEQYNKTIEVAQKLAKGEIDQREAAKLLVKQTADEIREQVRQAEKLDRILKQIENAQFKQLNNLRALTDSRFVADVERIERETQLRIKSIKELYLLEEEERKFAIDEAIEYERLAKLALYQRLAQEARQIRAQEIAESVSRAAERLANAVSKINDEFAVFAEGFQNNFQARFDRVYKFSSVMPENVGNVITEYVNRALQEITRFQDETSQKIFSITARAALRFQVFAESAATQAELIESTVSTLRKQGVVGEDVLSSLKKSADDAARSAQEMKRKVQDAFKDLFPKKLIPVPEIPEDIKRKGEQEINNVVEGWLVNFVVQIKKFGDGVRLPFIRELNRVNRDLGQMAKSFQTFVRSFATKDILGLVTSIASVWTNFRQLLRANSKSQEEYNQQLLEQQQRLQQISDAAKDFTLQLTGMLEALEPTAASLNLVRDRISETEAFLASFAKQVFLTVSELFGDFAERLFDPLVDEREKLDDILREILPDLTEIWVSRVREASLEVSRLLREQGITIPRTAEELIGLLDALINQTTGAVKETLQGIRRFVERPDVDAEEFLRQFFQLGFAQEALDKFGRSSERIRQIIDKLNVQMRLFGKTGQEALNEFLQFLSKEFGINLPRTVDDLKNFVGRAIEALSAGGEEFIAFFERENIKDLTAEQFRGILDTIIRFITDVERQTGKLQDAFGRIIKNLQLKFDVFGIDSAQKQLNEVLNSLTKQLGARLPRDLKQLEALLRELVLLFISDIEAAAAKLSELGLEEITGDQIEKFIRTISDLIGRAKSELAEFQEEVKITNLTKTITFEQANRMIDELATIREINRQMLDVMRSGQVIPNARFAGQGSGQTFIVVSGEQIQTLPPEAIDQASLDMAEKALRYTSVRI